MTHRPAGISCRPAARTGTAENQGSCQYLSLAMGEGVVPGTIMGGPPQCAARIACEFGVSAVAPGRTCGFTAAHTKLACSSHQNLGLTWSDDREGKEHGDD